LLEMVHILDCCGNHVGQNALDAGSKCGYISQDSCFSIVAKMDLEHSSSLAVLLVSGSCSCGQRCVNWEFLELFARMTGRAVLTFVSGSTEKIAQVCLTSDQ